MNCMQAALRSTKHQYCCTDLPGKHSCLELSRKHDHSGATLFIFCRCRAGADGAAKSGKPLTPDEAKALAAREAARQRVQMRTAQGFGLGL